MDYGKYRLFSPKWAETPLLPALTFHEMKGFFFNLFIYYIDISLSEMSKKSESLILDLFPLSNLHNIPGK